jgi:signal transduction histidine kinase
MSKWSKKVSENRLAIAFIAVLVIAGLVAYIVNLLTQSAIQERQTMQYLERQEKGVGEVRLMLARAKASMLFQPNGIAPDRGQVLARLAELEATFNQVVQEEMSGQQDLHHKSFPAFMDALSPLILTVRAELENGTGATLNFSALRAQLHNVQPRVNDLASEVQSAREAKNHTLNNAYQNASFWAPALTLILTISVGCIAIVFYRQARRHAGVCAALEVRSNAAEVSDQRIKETMATKTAFINAISHELRTPLQTILLGINHVIDVPPRLRNKGTVESLRMAVEHMESQVRAVTDVEKLDSGTFQVHYEAYNPTKVLARLLNNYDNLSESKGLKIARAFQIEEVLVHSDQARFQQIVSCLIQNAIKYAKQGVILVDLYLYQTGEGKRELRLIVEDDGPGIPKHLHTRIFEPFVQVDESENRSYEGTGMGLTLVKRIAEFLGGRVTIESDIGAGSVFEVRLPVTEVEPTIPSLQSTGVPTPIY